MSAFLRREPLSRPFSRIWPREGLAGDAVGPSLTFLLLTNPRMFLDTLIGGIPLMMYVAVLIPAACLIVIALLALYVPTIYIRKTNKIIHLLEEIAANTRKS